jgi:hypothetical protein
MNIEDMILFFVFLVVAILFWKSPPDNNDPDWR